MLMKSRVSDTFQFDSKYWTSELTHRPDDLNTDTTAAMFSASLGAKNGVAAHKRVGVLVLAVCS